MDEEKDGVNDDNGVTSNGEKIENEGDNSNNKELDERKITVEE